MAKIASLARITMSEEELDRMAPELNNILGFIEQLGEVDIAPGDYMIGDRDGLIRVPKGIVTEVVERSEEAISTESAIRKAIKGGMDPQEAYLKYGKF